jgi:hypothetical protein
MIAGVLTAYIRWCFAFEAGRDHIWRETIRRAAIFPIILIAILVSQSAIDRVDTRFDRTGLLSAFIVAWLVPPFVMLVRYVIAAPQRATPSEALPSSTDDREITNTTAVAALVLTAVIAFGVWFLVTMNGGLGDSIGPLGMMPPVALTVALFLLTRRTERSVPNHSARRHRLGLLWSIGIALAALQIAAVALVMNRMTPTIGVGVFGMVLASGGLLAFLLRVRAPKH